jgi:rod shape-determining protein MreC
METFLSRYRNLTVLVLLLLGQLLLLAYQVKTGQDVRLIRVWAVTAVTPLARTLEAGRSGTAAFFGDYFALRQAKEENSRLREENGRLKLETQFLKNELATADRVKSLEAFVHQTQSRTIAARVIGTGTGLNSRVVYVDRGSASGVQKSMAVITPDGIVGKVIASYPTASLVMLVTEQGFAAGVVSAKGRVRGVLRGQGSSNCIVDHVQNEEKVEAGEWFYTSGDDRIFPKGLPAGQVTVVRDGRQGKEIILSPSGMKYGVEEVLIVLEGVHGVLPEPGTPSNPTVAILPPPPPEGGTPPEAADSSLRTDADKLRERYRRIGEAQNHQYGEKVGGAPDYNRPLPAPKPDAGKTEAPKPEAPKPGAAKPPAPTPEGGRKQ